MNFSKLINYLTDICSNGTQGTSGTKSSIVGHNLVPVQGKILSPNSTEMDGKSLPWRQITNHQTLLQICSQFKPKFYPQIIHR
jgi:hypothetical protein